MDGKDNSIKTQEKRENKTKQKTKREERKKKKKKKKKIGPLLVSFFFFFFFDPLSISRRRSFYNFKSTTGNAISPFSSLFFWRENDQDTVQTNKNRNGNVSKKDGAKYDAHFRISHCKK